MLHEIFTSLLDDILYERILEESLESHQAELFQKTNDLTLDMESSIYKPEESTNCFICYSDISKKDKIYELPCGHVYHKECLIEAVQHQHRLCPVCRKEIPVKEIKIENKETLFDEHSIIYHEV